MNNLFGNLQEALKQSSFGRLFAKKMQESIDFAIAFREGEIDRSEALDYLKLRDRLLGLDCEAAHYLVFLAPLLVEAFPDAQFLFPIRPPRSWLRSVINQTINSSREYLPEHHVQLRDLNFGSVP